MDWKKLTHSKCPGCKKYGLPSHRTGHKNSSIILTCSECGRHYETNVGINIIAFFGSMILMALCIFRWIDPLQGSIPDWLLEALRWGCGILWIFFLFLYDRFAPLKEVFEE